MLMDYDKLFRDKVVNLNLVNFNDMDDATKEVIRGLVVKFYKENYADSKNNKWRIINTSNVLRRLKKEYKNYQRVDSLLRNLLKSKPHLHIQLRMLISSNLDSMRGVFEKINTYRSSLNKDLQIIKFVRESSKKGSEVLKKDSEK